MLLRMKYIMLSLLLILIILIGISRIYLGVHYTSDVLAGFLIFISYLIICIDGFNIYGGIPVLSFPKKK